MTIQSFQELLVTNYGLLPSGYTGSQGTQGIQGPAGTSAGVPKITGIQVTDSLGTVLDDTAVDVAGGHVVITGTGFESGCQVMINNVPAAATTFVSATQVRAQLPATAAGTYIVYLVNTDGAVAIRLNGVTFSTTPTWTTGGTLPTGDTGAAISIQLAATGATTFSLAAGSTLPGTLTVSSSGLLSGTVPNLINETTYSFTIMATDAELQDSPRTFTITITAGDPSFAATTLLLPGSATTFVQDASANNFAITVVGDTRPNTFNPYLTSWSNFFDGNGDYLSAPYNAATDILSGDFAVECWINHTSAQYDVIASSWGQTGINSTDGWILRTGDNNELAIDWAAFSTNGAFITTANNVIRNRTWHHVAFTRSGNTFNVWVDGVSVGTGTSSGTNSSQYRIDIGFYGNGSLGASPASFFNGHISNLRIVKGNPVYTASFAVPTAPLTAIAGTGLLTCQSNRFRDASTNAFAITRNGDVTVDGFGPFVEPTTTRGSGFFDGNGDSLVVPPNPQTYLSSDSFTIEAWVYPNANNGIIVGRRASVAARGFFLGFGGSGELANKFYFWAGDTDFNTWNVQLNSADTYPLNQWCHVAATRNSSNVFTLWINGVSQASATASFAIADDTSNLQIGIIDTAGSPFNGYISNLRIIKGTALYTTAFTPPAVPLTAVANTSLLTLQNNQSHNNSQFLDSSTENFPISRSGNTTQGTFSPYSPSGWSNFFDGNGDFLSAGNNAALNLSGGDFTVEAWIYLTALPALNVDNNRVACILTYSSSTTNQGYSFSADLTGNTFAIQSIGSANWARASFTFALATWYHVAATRSGSTDRLFVNGQLLTLNANAFPNNSSATGTLKIGAERLFANYNHDFPGYISNVRIVKGTAVYTANFTPSTQPLTAIAGTSLLTCADNRFIDDSANNFSLTRNGDVRVTNFSPFRAQTPTPNTYSAFFDGSGDDLSVPTNAAFTYGTGDFCIEGWFYFTGGVGGSGYSYLFAQGASTGAASLGLYIQDGVYKVWNGSAVITSAASFVQGSWVHLAVTRSGTTMRLFVNGVQSGSATNSSNITTGTTLGISIGRWAELPDTNYITGYVSNFRVIKGTAVYTSNFTPSTTPLAAVANTSLLTCQSATFVDNSTNRLTITAVGNSQPVMVNPFGFTFTNTNGYSVADHGGSVFFTNKTDTLSVPANTALTTFSGNFTFECWVYPTNAAVQHWGLWDARQSSATAQPMIFNLVPLASAVSGSYRISYYNGTAHHGTGVVTVNQWSHVAFVRVGTTLTFYVNGVAGGTATVSGTQTANATTNPIVIGSKDSGIAEYGTAGYIANLRINNGTALYTASFVPPLAPVQPVAGTTLLLNGTGAAITDATTKNVLETVGDVRVSTVVSRFGGSSIFFDGTVDRLFVPGTQGFGSGDWTVECWVYPTSIPDYSTIYDNRDGVQGVGIYIRTGIAVANNSNVIGEAGTISVNAWTHIAFSRQNGTLRGFINGSIVISITDSRTYGFAGGAWIGSSSISTFGYTGYMQDFRITTGIARYTANFTAPTTSLRTR
jgi:hypothetical protein